jgi:hypothetical protein
MSIIYHGNNSSWVNQDYIKLVLSTDGEVRPHPNEEADPWKADQINKWNTIGHDIGGAQWHMYYYKDFGLKSMSDMPLPLDLPGMTEWWIVKINPTKCFPMHQDAFPNHNKHYRRFWVPLQDYTHGHIFIYNGELVSNYKAGDIYEFTDPLAWHGASNIGFDPKVSFQIAYYQDV